MTRRNLLAFALVVLGLCALLVWSVQTTLEITVIPSRAGAVTCTYESSGEELFRATVATAIRTTKGGKHLAWHDSAGHAVTIWKHADGSWTFAGHQGRRRLTRAGVDDVTCHWQNVWVSE